ncbi:hypothetical protein E2562_031570 [Oryza meyeriana var. granulata]|uniref:Uncharacterized protein n=1 Tax=Oryza meyeriana var. granulata TaxID=110450 RepID=A0A6G1CJN5_9ORYZ|nr:hypothetical protein E2562_031570 [Oryza meyeriana var. granulata]
MRMEIGIGGGERSEEETGVEAVGVLRTLLWLVVALHSLFLWLVLLIGSGGRRAAAGGHEGGGCIGRDGDGEGGEDLPRALVMNSVVHAFTSPSPATSPPPEGKQEHAEIAVHVVGDSDEVVRKDDEAPGGVDYSGRAQWLRAAVLGANDGLVSVASLMIGVGAVNESGRAMLVSGIAGLVAGACSMAIGEYVSVYAQYDIEVAAQLRRKKQRRRRREAGEPAEKVPDEEEHRLPSPFKAAAASALAFAVGALLPLLAGAFIRPWTARVAVVCATTSAALAGFGGLGAVLGGASPARSAARVLLGGWAAMAVCYGVLRLFAIM